MDVGKSQGGSLSSVRGVHVGAVAVAVGEAEDEKCSTWWRIQLSEEMDSDPGNGPVDYRQGQGRAAKRWA